MVIKYGALEMMQAEWKKAFEAGDGKARVAAIKAHGQLMEWRKKIHSLMQIDARDDNGDKIMYRFIKYNNDKILTWKEAIDANI